MSSSLKNNPSPNTITGPSFAFYRKYRQMKANISPEDLILYIYKETSLEQTLCIEQALQEDWTLMEKCKVLRAAVKRLDDMKQSPRTEAVLNILHYATEKNAKSMNIFQGKSGKE